MMRTTSRKVMESVTAKLQEKQNPESVDSGLAKVHSRGLLCSCIEHLQKSVLLLAKKQDATEGS